MGSRRRVDATATPTSGSVTVTPDVDPTDLSPTGDARVTNEGVT